MIKFKPLILCTAFILFNMHSFAQAPDWNWVKAIGDTSNDECKSLTVDAFANVYSTGYFYGTVDFNPGNGIFNLNSVGFINIFICKLDSSGNFIWAKSFGGNGSGGQGYSISLDDSGNIYTTGYFSGTVDFDPGIGVHNLTSNGSDDIFILKLDNSGNFLWANAIGGPTYDAGDVIDVDPFGNVYVTGHFVDTVDFDPGLGVQSISSNGWVDLFLLKLDSNGNFIWAKTIGSTGTDQASAMTIDLSGNIYIGGYFEDTVDFDTGPGVLNLISPAQLNIFIAKLDSTGELKWAKAITGRDGSVVLSVALDQFSNVYTTGYFFSGADFDPGVGVANLSSYGLYAGFISKLDSSGNYVWAKSMGGMHGGLLGKSITLDASGYIYLCGEFYGTIDIDPDSGVYNLISNSVGYQDVFVSKMDPLGNLVWAKSLGGSRHDSGNSIALDFSNNIYVCGYFESPALMIDTTLLLNSSSTNNSPDLFIGKIENLLTNIESIDQNNLFMAYPNPANDRLNLVFRRTVKNAVLSVYNSSGIMMLNTNLDQVPRFDLSTKTFSGGVYFLRIQNEEFEETLRFVVIN